ncbi:MAG: serine hydrolase domain-containing protein [Candidatus Velthaea sp.]|jgi:CubicO group peptidase (beta-lactamase class C family)
MSTDKLAATIDTIVTAALERQHLPGISLAVARAGEILFAGGFGYRNVGEALPADADTIYSIASISKQFTAAAIMRLAERGLLRIDDPVDRYFPQNPYGDRVTLRHLLTHTSGIPDYFPLEELDRLAFTEASPGEIIQCVAHRGATFAPGAEYQYCNTGYVMLGAIIERVANQSYAHYLQTNFFDPLEMTRTGVDDTPAIHRNLAIGYTSFVLGPWELARDYHPTWEFATGGLYSTVLDVLKWNRALRSGRVVGAASLALMTARARLGNGQSLDYGFGLSVNDVDGLQEIRHTGGLPGISTDNATYPGAGIDIVAFVNHDSCSMYATVVRPILALLHAQSPAASAREPALPMSSGLDERPWAQHWIRTAAAGGIGDLPLSARFERFLNPGRRARFAELRAYGEITGIRLIEASRRDPETAFSYRVDFERGPLVATLAVRDDGTLANLQFLRWDDRA